MEWAYSAFNSCLAHVHRDSHMCTRAYITVSCVGDMTMFHVGHIGLEDPVWLCKLPECFLVHAQPWNLEVPVRVLGGGNHHRHSGLSGSPYRDTTATNLASVTFLSLRGRFQINFCPSL